MNMFPQEGWADFARTRDIDRVLAESTARFDQFEARIFEHFGQLMTAQFSHFDQRMNARFAEHDRRIESFSKALWAIGSIFGSAFIAIFSILETR